MSYACKNSCELQEIGLLQHFIGLDAPVGCEGRVAVRVLVLVLVAVRVRVTVSRLGSGLLSDESVHGHDRDGEHRNRAQQHTHRKHPVRVRLHLRLRELLLRVGLQGHIHSSAVFIFILNSFYICIFMILNF